jgi:hypothetical protein
LFGWKVMARSVARQQYLTRRTMRPDPGNRGAHWHYSPAVRAHTVSGTSVDCCGFGGAAALAPSRFETILRTSRRQWRALYRRGCRLLAQPRGHAVRPMGWHRWSGRTCEHVPTVDARGQVVRGPCRWAQKLSDWAYQILSADGISVVRAFWSRK